jgi:uncharacterized protein
MPQTVCRAGLVPRPLANVNTICKYRSVRFTWDAVKNRSNVRRHGIALQDAARIFDGPTVEREDDRYDYGEVRNYAIGLVNGIEITVIYTDRSGDERHLISAWRSEPHERRYLWRHIEA